MSTPRTAPYGSWKSPITADLIAAGTVGLFEVLLDGDDLYWIESRPAEGGRYVLIRRDPLGQTAEVTPAPFNVRTRVHEYGGGAVTLAEGVAYFSNFKDQRLYRVEPDKEPTPLTPDAAYRYADGVIDQPRRLWVGVREDHTDPSREAVNALVAVDLDGKKEQRVLASGHDFYSTPRLRPDGGQLAWLAWDHPDMPWTATRLFVADIADGNLSIPRQVAGGPGESIYQPAWSPAGELFFVSDRSGWWNLYRLAGDEYDPLCPMEAEFGWSQWVFGRSTYAFLSADEVLCAYTQNGIGRLARLDVKARSLTPLDLPFSDFSYLCARGNRAAFRAGSASRPAGVVLLDVPTGSWEMVRQTTNIIEQHALAPYLSEPEPLEFPTVGTDENGAPRTAHALYYPPRNPDFAGPGGELPPLVVRCHGGPTGAASATLNLAIQFYTSRGIAVVDVNYGGSIGYGRAYRERLDGQWGIVDVDDCVHAAKHLVAQGRVDGERAVITGGSAGGYTTLAALTMRTFFKGGASHYGVSDAEGLAKDTHKFESRYLDSLIGPYPEAAAVYRGRSPIHHADKVTAPVIFFQGDEDKIVLPDQTERMVEALRARGLPVGYLLFSGEQHGFRKAENIQRALDAELTFFSVLVFKTGLTF